MWSFVIGVFAGMCAGCAFGFLAAARFFKVIEYVMESSPGVQMIADERRKQVRKLRGVEHDAQYKGNELVRAAACCAMNERLFIRDSVLAGSVTFTCVWPGWEVDWADRPRAERLTIAGALIAAELDVELAGGRDATGAPG